MVFMGEKLKELDGDFWPGRRMVHPRRGSDRRNPLRNSRYWELGSRCRTASVTAADKPGSSARRAAYAGWRKEWGPPSPTRPGAYIARRCGCVLTERANWAPTFVAGFHITDTN